MTHGAECRTMERKYERLMHIRENDNVAVNSKSYAGGYNER